MPVSLRKYYKRSRKLILNADTPLYITGAGFYKSHLNDWQRASQKKEPRIRDSFWEATTGIGPVIRVLQTRALPLRYVAILTYKWPQGDSDPCYRRERAMS